jgi:hypothetical protein
MELLAQQREVDELDELRLKRVADFHALVLAEPREVPLACDYRLHLGLHVLWVWFDCPQERRTLRRRDSMSCPRMKVTVTAKTIAARTGFLVRMLAHRNVSS